MNEKICKYCLQSDNQESIISPCLCNGSIKYVHKKCLIEWILQKIINSGTNNIYPGFSQTRDFRCELCLYRYNIIEYEDTRNNKTLYINIIFYIFLASLFHISLYILFGKIMSVDIFLNSLFFENNYSWSSVFINGFIITHIMLALIYITRLISDYRNNQNHIYILWFITIFDYETLPNGIEGFIEIYLFILLGFFIWIYYDVIAGLILKHKLTRNIIIDIV
jgi:E3 ubiquitin-protein ligase DOA10